MSRVEALKTIRIRFDSELFLLITVNPCLLHLFRKQWLNVGRYPKVDNRVIERYSYGFSLGRLRPTVLRFGLWRPLKDSGHG